jgi:hypothetical protein
VKWVEVIKVRAIGEAESLLVAEILREFTAMEKRDQPTAMKIYRHATVESDRCIHLYWESESLLPGKSVVGFRIVESIGGLGVANHSIWVEDVSGIQAPESS